MMKYYIETMGCQMNERDSETIAGMLEATAYTCSSRNEADVLVLNTCSVRENADKRFFGVLGQLKKIKEKKNEAIVAVCGCMMQQQHIVDEIKSKYSWVDIVFGTHNIHEFPRLLENVINEKRKVVAIWDEGEDIVEGLPSKREFPFKAYVNIMNGCNNFCTYCIVPYTRGRERSRAPEEIVKEVKRLVNDGVREITLLGQNVNSYKGETKIAERTGETKITERTEETKIAERTDEPPITERAGEAKIAERTDETKITERTGETEGQASETQAEIRTRTQTQTQTLDFPDLIYRLNAIDDLERIRFMTSHPKDVSEKLINAFKDCEKLCNSIHLPVQSGSTKVLNEMNRHYTKEGYLELIRKVREASPDIVITTDIIVGFPGESEEDFGETLDLVEKVRFDSAFTFIYSIRKGTPAAECENQVSEEVKHLRFNELIDTMNKITYEKNQEYIGRIEKVLVEGISKTKDDMISGRTNGGKLVNFKGDEAMIGQIVDVEIVDVATFSFLGRTVN